jgi:hypothetical protein
MSRRVTVHHFVANLTTRQYGPHPTSDLLGVDYVHDVSADTEFPCWIPRVDLFTRFYLRRAQPIEFTIRVRWLDARGAGKFRQHFGPFSVPFQLTDSVRDWSFRLNNVQLDGVGRYEVLLLRRKRVGWDPDAWVKYAETHFVVER